MFKYILHVTHIQSSRRYSTKTNKIKKLMKEYKSVFGELVETSAQKKKRLKLEKKGVIPRLQSNNVDSELFWIKENISNNLKRINRIQDKSLNYYDSSPITNNIINYNETGVTKVLYTDQSTDDSNVQNDASLSSVSLSNTKKQDTRLDASLKSKKRLPNIIIKNMLTFPIISNKQEFLAESTEVLSLSGKDDPETIGFPSVTKILTQTMSPESKLALEIWKEKLISKLGKEGFEMHQKALLEDGKSLHSCIAQSLLGKEYEVPPRIEPIFQSVRSVLEDVNHVKAIETHVAHTKLHYKGVIDCVASYRGNPYIIDWKKSDRQKSNLKETYDAPVQIAAYIGAVNASNLYPFVIKRGLLVIAYTCGAPASVYEVCDNTLKQYWTIWLSRLQKYYVETRDNSNKSTG